MRLQVFVRIFVWLAIAPILMVSCANQVPIVDTSSLYASAIGDIQLEVSAQGTVQRVWGELLSPTTQAEFRYDPYAAAVRFYRNHALAFGVNSSTEFSLRTSYPSREGGVVVRLEQSHQGLPVLNTDALLHFGPSGIVRDLAIRFDAEVDLKSLKPLLEASTVTARIIKHFKSKQVGFLTASVYGTPKLAIYSAEFDKRIHSDTLVWTFDVYGSDTRGARSLSVVANASTGKLLDAVDLIQTISHEVHDLTGLIIPRDLPRVVWSNPAISEDNPNSKDAEVVKLFELAKSSYTYFNQSFA